MIRLIRFALPLLALALLLPSLARAVQAEPADRIVAIVNDEAITQSELRSRIATVERQFRAQNISLPPQDVMERQMLEKMISDRIQLQFARDSGLQVQDGELDGALRRIAAGNGMTVADFRAALDRDGVNWMKFREEIRDEITISRLREREVDSRMAITDGEVDNYLANPVSAESEGMLNLAHVLIRTPEQASPEQLARMRARAEEALNHVKAGEDFGKVAASFSDAPDAMSGGVIGLRPVDRLPTLYAEAALKLQPGEVSPVLRSPAGFHFIKLLERKGGVLATPVLNQTHARHILIRVNEVTSDSEAKRKLDDLKERLDHGANFAELARLYSSDLSAAKGGDLGWLYQGDTVPEFEKAMDALKIGEVSAPVRSPFGWHLIQVLERRTDEASPERKRMAARQALRERRSDEAYQDWLRQMRDRAYVEYRRDE